MAVIDAPDTDLAAPAAVADPYPLLHRLRAVSPVVWAPEHRAWLLLSHREVLDGFKDHDRLSSRRLDALASRFPPARKEALETTFRVLSGWMVFYDEPDHTRLRAPVRRSFTPRRVDQLRDEIAALVEVLLDEIEAPLRDGEAVDLRAAFAFPLPATVIAALLGVPLEDRDRFKTWSSELTAMVFGTAEGDKDAVAERGSAAFADYFGWLVRRYRDEPEDNLISALVAAARDEQLSADELVGACTLLLFGGHETTTNLICNAVVGLGRFPAEQRRLLAQPGLVADAVEEALRWDGPAKLMVRAATVDHERGGQRIGAGDSVYLVQMAANRDPAVFAEPDEFRVDRRPSNHVAFGYGNHFCLGAALARLEGQLALGALFRRFGELVVGDDLAYEPLLLSRSVASLPVRLR